MQDSLHKAMDEREAQEAARKKKAEAQQKANSAETLKAEGRAYAINALICYCKAFDLLDGEEIDQEDVDELEKLLIGVERMVPMYIKLYKMREDMDKEFGGLFK